MRVVIDTNVIVSAVLTESGTCARVLGCLRDGLITAIVDASVVAEYRSVLQRPRFAAIVSESMAVIDALAAAAEWCDSTLLAPPLPDPGDQCFADLACTARADALVLTPAELLVALRTRDDEL
jgi:uncharacterized protein